MSTKSKVPSELEVAVALEVIPPVGLGFGGQSAVGEEFAAQSAVESGGSRHRNCRSPV